MKKLIFSVMVVATLGLLATGCKSDDEPEIPAEPEAPLARPASYIKDNIAVKLAAKAMIDFGYMTPEEAAAAKYNVSLKNALGSTDSLYFEVEFPGVAYVAVDADYYNPVGVVAVCESTPPDENILNAFLPVSMDPVESQGAAQPTLTYTEYSYPTPNWGQKAPYNAYAPIIESGKHGVLGRLPVAIGEILAYYKSPIIVDGQKFDWSAVDPYNPDDAGLDEIARLLNQIGKDACYYEEGFGYAAAIKDLRDFFAANGFNYSLCDIESLLASDALSKGPAVMTFTVPLYGYGWRFAADGMKKWTSEGTSVTYIHFNMGDNGNGNGYYLVNAIQYDKQTKELCEMILPEKNQDYMAVSRQ